MRDVGAVFTQDEGHWHRCGSEVGQSTPQRQLVSDELVVDHQVVHEPAIERRCDVRAVEV